VIRGKVVVVCPIAPRNQQGAKKQLATSRIPRSQSPIAILNRHPESKS
jgi:hypothetical protein